MFARAALMPPYAATVCERVGNNFEIQAVLKPLNYLNPIYPILRDRKLL